MRRQFTKMMTGIKSSDVRAMNTDNKPSSRRPGNAKYVNITTVAATRTIALPAGESILLESSVSGRTVS